MKPSELWKKIAINASFANFLNVMVISRTFTTIRVLLKLSMQEIKNIK